LLCIKGNPKQGISFLHVLSHAYDPWINGLFISRLQKDIARRDQRIDQLQHELQMQIAEKENATKSLKLQVKELNDRFRVVDETGVS